MDSPSPTALLGGRLRFLRRGGELLHDGVGERVEVVRIPARDEAVESLAGDAEVDVDDAAGGGFFVTEDGTFATIDCTSPREHSSMQFTFVGSEGKLYLNNDDGEWRYWALEDGEHVEQLLPGIEGQWTWEGDYRRGFGNAADHVEALLDGDATNESPGVEAMYSLEIIVALFVSHHADAHVDVPLARPLRDVTITSW